MFLVEKVRFQFEQQVTHKTLAYVKSLLVSRKEWQAKQDAKANQPQPRYGSSFFLSHSPLSLYDCTSAPRRGAC
jgi:hypothetical protein